MLTPAAEHVIDLTEESEPVKTEPGDLQLQNIVSHDADAVSSGAVAENQNEAEVLELMVELTKTNVPADVLKQAILKGFELHRRRELTSLFKPNTYLVRSYSDINSLGHQVEYKMATGYVKCECQHSKVSNLCAHAIAVAKELGILDLYAKNVSSKTITLTQLSSVNVPKNNGRKTPAKGRSRPLSPANASPVLSIPGSSRQASPALNSSASSSSNVSIWVPTPIYQVSLGKRGPSPGVVGLALPGGRLPEPPPPAFTDNKYEVMLRTGRIKSCCSCDSPHHGTLHLERYVLRRAEREYYPHSNDDGSRSYHLSKKSNNKHYHLKKACLLKRNQQFDANTMLAPITINIDTDLRLLLTSIGLQFA